MRRHRLAVCILGFLSVPAFAGSAPHWLQVHTAHFTIVSDASPTQARHIAAQLERMQAVFSRLIPSAHADTGAPIIVLALKDRTGFRSIEPADYLAKNQIDLSGLFINAPDRSYILLRLDAGGEHPYATVYHEYTHYILRHATDMPLWLNEGLAEFYQNTDIDQKEVLFGQPSADDILYLRQQNLLPLPTLFAVDHHSPYYHDEQKGSVFYSESWALTHYIVMTDRLNHTDHLNNYVSNLAAHQDPVTAARNAFGDLKKLQSVLESYVDHGDYRLFKMPMTVNVDEASFRVDPLPTSDADAIRADILIDTGRIPEAQTLLSAVLRDDPDNAQAHESMGALCFRTTDLRCALKWYSQAVALHSTSYLAYYYVAAISRQLGLGAEADLEANLQQSLKLNPSFAPANDALASLYSTNHKNLDDALHLSILAVSLDPTDLNYRLNNAQIHMERQEIPSALAVLAAARPFAKTPGELVEIDIRTENIKHYQEQLDRMRQYDAASAAAASVNASSETATETPTGTATATGTATETRTETLSGRVLALPTPTGPDNQPPFPDTPPTGPRHTIRGVLYNVHCTYPTVLTLTIEGAGKSLALYTNHMDKIAYTAANFTPTKSLDPCNEFGGMKASITYTEVSDKRVAGQILSIAVSK